ncbi:MAG: TIGR03960 family B12-binding radical SAM protein [candidate division WOR-3 bacterium]
MYENLKEILPLVNKPIRYTGGEYNILIKEPETETIFFGLIMPDIYEIGMSNYGLKILYSILNQNKRVIAERAYAPWPDFGAKLKTNSFPLYSLESKRPLKNFHILGFSLQSELSYTNILYVLDIAQIPLLSENRTPSDPLIIAGGPCCVNPLPLKSFIDAFVIGDGEEVVLEIVTAFADWNRKNRSDLLAALAKIEGVYVPLIHSSGQVIKKRTVAVLNETNFPYPPIVPICEIVHDRLTIEITRGCTRGCRFCQAGILNRPLRIRPKEEIIRLAERGIRSSGWEEISLLALSPLDYPELPELVKSLTQNLQKRMVALSLPSMRGEKFSSELAQLLAYIKKSGLTFAPETMSPRLRALVNKDIADTTIINAVKDAVSTGWKGIKLYFMIGLPGETESEVLAIADFVETISQINRKGEIRFNLSTFTPKPHTPLQWAGFESLPTLKHKIETIRHRLRRKNLRPKWDNPEMVMIQTVLARGDEKLGEVIRNVYGSGGIFQEWSEFFNFQRWQDTAARLGVDLAAYLKPIALDQPLPWDFINVGVSKDFLKNEYLKAQRGEKTQDCAIGECTDCGACTDLPNRIPKQNLTEVTKGNVDYGRLPRRITGFELLKTRFRIKYSVGENFRYASHLDLVRAFYRAFRRSELPIAYSQGFSPRPLISFGPPLPVGVTSQGEYLDFQMAHHYSGNIVRDFGPFLPRDLRIIAVQPIGRQTESLGKIINLAKYEITDIGKIDQKEILTRKDQINGIYQLDFGPNQNLFIWLQIAPKIKLFATLAQLLNWDEEKVRVLKIERKDCYVLLNGKIMTPLEVL